MDELLISDGRRRQSLHAEWKFVLYAFADGESSPESAVQLFERLTSAAAQSGISKLLIDVRFVTGTISDDQRIEIGKTLADNANKLSPKPHVAVIGHVPTCNRIAITIARKLGFDVELFESFADGVAWLRHKSLEASAEAG